MSTNWRYCLYKLGAETGDGGWVWLNFRSAGVVEIEEVVFLLGIADAHGGTGMLVEDAGDHVGDERSPLLGAAEWHEVFL